jgi:hypothetical protein
VQLLPDCLQVIRGIRKRVGRSVEVVEVFGPVQLGRQQVVEGESKLLGQMANGRMALIDELAAVLGYLAAGDCTGLLSTSPSPRDA